MFDIEFFSIPFCFHHCHSEAEFSLIILLKQKKNLKKILLKTDDDEEGKIPSNDNLQFDCRWWCLVHVINLFRATSAPVSGSFFFAVFVFFFFMFEWNFFVFLPLRLYWPSFFSSNDVWFQIVGMCLVAVWILGTRHTPTRSTHRLTQTVCACNGIEWPENEETNAFFCSIY